MAGFQIPQLGNRPSDAQKEFKRAYMACIPCRKTKAKCEISDDSNDCVKCRRERRECVFAPERSSRKRKRPVAVTEGAQSRTRSSGHTTQTPELSFSERSGPHSLDRSHRVNLSTRDQISNNTLPATPRQQTVHRTTNSSGIPAPVATRLEPGYDSDVVNTEVFSSRDALGLLFKAAENHDSDESDDPDITTSATRAHESPGSALTAGAPIPPIPTSNLSNPERSILDLWSEHKFVRQGWFSPVEGVTYIDLFFRNLSSLSPISDVYYADHANHKDLILNEPLLCCTILMISSRYHVLPGPGGASRAEFVHSRVWKFCEHLIARITFGQEKNSVRCRALGSIQALLLMTEWHPRALHFPPEQDGWDGSLAPGIDNEEGTRRREDNAHLNPWREEVFEPAKRSDKLSWMLLGLATTLAHELGVFEDPDPEDDANKVILPASRLRVRRLLYLYVNQLSLRLGCTSFLSQTYTMSLTPPRIDLQDAATRDRDLMISQWIEITKLRKTTTEMFFPSKSATRQIMQSGRYISLLEHFRPLLAQWYKGFTELKTTTVTSASKKMIFIDYSYVRMYINSIAIQALIDRVKTRETTPTLINDYLIHENHQDYRYIQEVVDACRNILSAAAELAGEGVLRYCPVRVFLCITSASIFLLKSLSVGTRTSDLQKSLDILDRCIHALRYSTHDDMHLASRYGTLINRHVRRFKHNFRVQSSLNNPAALLANQVQQGSTTIQETNQQERQQPTINADMAIQPSSPLDTVDLQDNINWEMDDWLAQPFDPSLAPFGMGITQAATAFEVDSLDFLWNLPN